MNIKTATKLPCSAKRAFDAWLDEKDHKAMVSDHPDCKFDVKEGGKWKVGSLEGDFIDIDKQNLKIVMSWRYVDGWNQSNDSKLTVQFVPVDDKSCKIRLWHTNVPEDLAEEIKEGWTDYYFDGMKEYLDGK